MLGYRSLGLGLWGLGMELWVCTVLWGLGSGLWLYAGSQGFGSLGVVGSGLGVMGSTLGHGGSCLGLWDLGRLAAPVLVVIGLTASRAAQGGGHPRGRGHLQAQDGGGRAGTSRTSAGIPGSRPLPPPRPS